VTDHDQSARSAVDILLNALGALQVHDVSPTIAADLPVFMAHQGPTITPLTTHADGGAATNRLTMAEHTGSHVDAPFHGDPGGLTMEQVPVESLLLRPFRKYDLSANEHQPGDFIGVEHLKAAEERDGFTLRAGDVAIIEAGWDRHLPDGEDPHEPAWWGRNQPGLSEEACDYLAQAGVVAVASDTAACDVAVRDGQVLGVYGHQHAFLPRGILIVEGLRHLAAAPATGLFLALPLKIAGGTGSPARVVLLTD
jgi:kynurenine formamidase